MLNTIGYEGARPSDFLQTLQVAKVQVVIDVRDRAQSRRPGFSKSALATSLDSIGVEYIHLKELGDPKEGRDAARAGDIAKFRSIFGNVLKSDPAKQAINEIIFRLKHSSVCLLCYERDVRDCHRKLISDKIELMTGAKARHLGVRSFGATH